MDILIPRTGEGNIVVTCNFNRKRGLVNLLPEAKHSGRYCSHHRDITNLINFSGEGTISADRIKPPWRSRVFAQGSVHKGCVAPGWWQGHLGCQAAVVSHCGNFCLKNWSREQTQLPRKSLQRQLEVWPRATNHHMYGGSNVGLKWRKA